MPTLELTETLTKNETAEQPSAQLEQLEREVADFVGRKAQIEAEKQSAEASTQAARAALENGDDKAVAQLTKFQGISLALGDTVASLGAKIGSKVEELSALKKAQERASNWKKCALLAHEGAAALRDYEKARADADIALKDAVLKMQKAVGKLEGIRAQIRPVVAELEPAAAQPGAYGSVERRDYYAAEEFWRALAQAGVNVAALNFQEPRNHRSVYGTHNPTPPFVGCLQPQLEALENGEAIDAAFSAKHKNGQA